MSTNPLAPGREQGSLRLAYRKSVVALQQAMGWKQPISLADGEDEGATENDPLLRGEGSSTGLQAGQYGSVMDLPPELRVPKPKKVRGPVRVEAKVWFANERTWISWLRVSLLIGSFSLAMFNSASYFSDHQGDSPFPPGEEPGPEIPPSTPNAQTIRTFAIIYALISVLTLGWGLFNYHRRLYLIKTKYAGDFDDLIGPPIICAAMFVAVLINFIVRVQQHNLDIGN